VYTTTVAHASTFDDASTETSTCSAPLTLSVASTNRCRVAVLPYAIDDEPTMQRVIDLGVDGIISDDPDLLVAVAKRNGLR
jgi:glycerophosphoryl diester phosphodiesterase